MFVNCSNHPSSKWSEKQIKEAKKWGNVVDYPFPAVPPTASKLEIGALADKIVNDICELNPECVMCQGEFTLAFQVVKGLLNRGIKVVASCSDRVVKEHLNEDGSVEKSVIYDFAGFREYI